MRLKPLGDRIIVKQLEAQETSKGGLLLTGQQKEKPQEGIVEAVGSGIVADSGRAEMFLKKGDHILIPPYGHMEVKFDGETYLIMRQGDVLGVFTPEVTENTIIVIDK